MNKSPKQIEQQVSVKFSELFRFATKTDYILIFVGLLSSIATGTAIPIFAYISGSMIDAFANQTQIYDQSKKNLFFYLLLGCAAGLMGMTSFSSWLISGERQTIECRKRYFRSLLAQQIAWFDTQKQAEISSKFSTDALLFQLAVGEKLSTVIMLISMIAAGIGISFYQGWLLSLVILAYLPVIVVCWYKDAVIVKQQNQLSDTIYLQADGKAQQTLSAIRLVKSMNAQRFQFENNSKVLQKVKQKSLEVGIYYAFWAFASILSINLGFALSFWYGSECVFATQKCPADLNRKAYTAGSVIKIFYSLLLPAVTLNQLTPCFQKISEGKTAAARIFKIIDRIPFIISKDRALKPSSFQGVFKFQNVSFAYPKNKSLKILQNLDLTIDCKSSAIVGDSGCGKSTIFQLMMRFYDPDQGRVTLDGEDLRELDLDWLRGNIGYVQQEPTLFAVSLRENLLLGKESASQQELLEALKKAEAYEFFKDLKDGFNTFVGSGGCQLSGGQKQRIAIARSLLKKPKVLLLDEATSALDRRNEKQILKTLKLISKEIVTVSITHRKSVLVDCDKVFYFKNKRIEKIELKSQQRLYLNVAPQQDDDSHSKVSQKQLSAENHQLVQKDRVMQNASPAADNKGLKSQNALVDRSIEVAQERAQSSKDKISNIYPYLFKNKCLVILAAVMSILDGLTFPLIGVMLAQIITAELRYPSDKQYFSGRVRIYCYICLGLAIFASIWNTVMHLCMFEVSSSSIKEIRELAYDKILKMPIEWFDKEQNQPQKILNKLSTNCKYLNNFILMFLPHIIIIIIGILFCIIGAIAFDWRTGLTSIGLIPLILLAQTIQFHFVQGFNESSGKAFENASQTTSQAIMSIRSVLSLEPSMILHRYQKQLSGIFDEITKRCLFSGFMYGISYMLQYITIGLIFFFSAIFIDKYNIDLASSFSAIFLILFACTSAGNNAAFVGDVSAAKTAANELFSILELEDQHQLRSKSGSKGLTTKITGNISFKNVSLKYQSRQEFALRNVSFDLKAGQKVGLIGSSGCGKSSIFSLLLGFYQPNEGIIQIDGVDIYNYDLHHLRSAFGVVNQEPVLFNESISWNIKYNHVDSAQTDIIKAAKQASFDPRIQRDFKNYQTLRRTKEEKNQSQQVLDSAVNLASRQEMDNSGLGFNRNVGPKGSHVSGGQKQRIAIARAILRNPTILMLDEATSALDPQNEKAVQQALDRMMINKTTLSITHRIETVSNSDKIMLFQDGELKAHGTYDELRKANGDFKAFLEGRANI